MNEPFWEPSQEPFWQPFREPFWEARVLTGVPQTRLVYDAEKPRKHAFLALFGPSCIIISISSSTTAA